MSTVNDLMSTELVTVGPSDRVDVARERMHDTGVRCVPVVDDGRAVGIVSSWDLTGSVDPEAEVASIMTADVVRIAPSELADDAARRMVEAFVHHLLVVDGDGELVGVLSSFDLLRELADL